MKRTESDNQSNQFKLVGDATHVEAVGTDAYSSVALVEENNVPNGTTVSTSDVCRLIEKYKGFAKQSAESIINLALTVDEAERNLRKDDLSLFFEEIGMSPTGSTFRKHKRIAESSARFMPMIDRLPNNWTTLYKLAALSGDQYQQLVCNGTIKPNMTARDIREIIAPNGNPKGGNDNQAKLYDVQISFSGLSLQKKFEGYSALERLQREFGFELTPSAALSSDLDHQRMLVA